jgi:Hen1-like subunit of RNA repair complex
MDLRELSAEVISRPGALGDSSYLALEIRVKGFVSPYVLTLALPAIAYRALAEQLDPIEFYDAIATAVNKNPFKEQEFALTFGRAHVSYTEAAKERCTAALLVDVDPIALVRSPVILRANPRGVATTLCVSPTSRSGPSTAMSSKRSVGFPSTLVGETSNGSGSSVRKACRAGGELKRAPNSRK